MIGKINKHKFKAKTIEVLGKGTQAEFGLTLTVCGVSPSLRKKLNYLPTPFLLSYKDSLIR